MKFYDTKLTYPLENKSVWVAGHNGMVGSAAALRLSREKCEILTVGRSDLDLRIQKDVECRVGDLKPQIIIVAAATVTGILANTNYPLDFLYDNLAITINILNAAHHYDVEKLLFIESACIYPLNAEQPISEEFLLTGSWEPTNELHAVAKIAAVKLCQAYRNQYGNDFIAAQLTIFTVLVMILAQIQAMLFPHLLARHTELKLVLRGVRGLGIG